MNRKDQKALRLNFAFQNTLSEWRAGMALAANMGLYEPHADGETFETRLFLDGFLERAKAMQKVLNVAQDGVVGSATLAAIFGKEEGITTRRSVLFAGEQIATNYRLPVTRELYRDFSGSAGCFDVWDTSPCRPSQIVLHWDACQSSAQCYQVLVDRRLSVHFTVDWDGTVRQHLDLALTAKHTKLPDEGRIGVEINTPYYMGFQGVGGRVRPVVTEGAANTEDEGSHKYLGFTQGQVRSVVSLCAALCDAFGIPRSIASDNEKPLTSFNVKAIDFRGVVGHYMLQQEKIDPGFQLWRPLMDAGFALR